MRSLVLSIGACTCVLSVAWAQSTGDNAPTQTVPVGKSFKNFEFPFYENGKLKWTATSTLATGITQNRAEAMDIRIKIYDGDTVSTTISSPQADIFVLDKRMRSSHTVLIERADMQATSQSCDFDLGNKKYVLRNNVKVILKNFDPGTSTGAAPATKASNIATPTAPTVPAPSTSRSLLNSDSLPESPGTLSSTNSAPIPPTSNDSK